MRRAADRSPRVRRTTVAILLLNVAVLAAVCVEVGARIVLYAMPYVRPDYRVHADGYAGADWTAPYYREFMESGDVDWRPYVYWRRRPYAGTYINIDQEGIRRTWSAADGGGSGRRPRIFVMGGSTVWGTGARDDHTIPSQLARSLSERGRNASVVNYGESGYVTGQSVAALLTALRRGDVPDVVTFYAGAEDVFSAFQNGAAGLPENEENRRLEFNATQPESIRQVFAVMTAGSQRLGLLLQRMRSSGARETAATVSPATGKMAASAVEQMCANVRIASALGAHYRFHVSFYLQPTIFTKPTLTPYEQRERDRYETSAALFAAAYAAIEDGACRDLDVHDISRLFERESRPLYVDAFHLTEDGNVRVAAVIAADVAGLIGRPDAAVAAATR
ncbi:MAG TPA: SGNH/GDSL hydrolase family protein [Vicinamibacterales bacterium]|nr:SGNH/GDSL hydrolase family protein [Vicinamibacterales bacterium]